MNKYPHSAECKCGLTLKEGALTPDHPWYVNRPQFHNCFWIYLRHNGRPHTLYEISKLLNLSISAITAIERKAFVKFQKRIKSLEIGKL